MRVATMFPLRSACLPNEVERRRFPRRSKNLLLRGKSLWNFSSRPTAGMRIVPARTLASYFQSDSAQVLAEAGLCLLWVRSGHRSTSAQCPLYPRKRTFAHSWRQTRWSPDRPRPPEHRRADNQRAHNESATVSLSHGRAGVTKSISSIYADYGTQWQEVAIPPQHGRIKAGRATAVQKQSVLASKLISEKTREFAKRNF